MMTDNMPAPAGAQEFDPYEKVTRGEVVAEVTEMWDQQITAIERSLERGGHDHRKRMVLEGRAQEMRFARKVLLNTFFSSELHNEAGVLGADTRSEEEAATRIQRGKR